MNESIKNILEALTKLPSREEFVKLGKALMELIAKTELALSKKIDERMATWRDGVDGKDGIKGDKGDKGDRGEKGERGATFIALRGAQGEPGASGKDGSSDTPVEVRDKLEVLPDGEKLSVQAIQDLPKLLDELGQRIASARSGASLISKRIRFVDDETPSGTVNSSNTIFTLVSKSPETGSLKVYVNGQRMRVTEDYTLSGKTITFLIAPPTGSIILVDYRY